MCSYGETPDRHTGPFSASWETFIHSLMNIEVHISFEVEFSFFSGYKSKTERCEVITHCGLDLDFFNK